MNHKTPQHLLALLFLPAIASLATLAPAQETPARTVTGTVRDTSGIPIPFVNVEGPKKLRALGDEEGRFRLELPSRDAISLTLRRLGYQPMTLSLPAGADTSVNVHLDLVVQQLSAIRVVTAAIETLRNRGFFARMADRERGPGSGQYITPEEIELRKPSRPTQLFDGRMNVVVRRVGNCYVLTRCYAIAGPNDCPMTIYLDGQRLLADGNLSQHSAGNTKIGSAPTYIDDLISPTSIAGIEIYNRGANAPPAYQTLNGTCGVVLIWTK
jgi:hypothetical protein